MRTSLITVSFLLITVAAVPAGAAEPDKPWINIRELVGVAGWPSGLLSDTKIQYRVPLHRSDSIIFQDTYAGAGGRARVTPAFVDLGPRLSLAPADFFDLDLQASAAYYWPSSSGLLPYDAITESTRDFDRGDRHRAEATRARPGWSLTASASPTLKAKLGPVIALDSWTFEYIHMRTDGDSPLVYEPFWDRLIERDDFVFDHQAALMIELLNGGSGPLLRIGGLFKQRWAIQSTDSTTQLGGLVYFKPSPSDAWPTFVGQVTAYVVDPDRVGRIPSMALAAIWQVRR